MCAVVAVCTRADTIDMDLITTGERVDEGGVDQVGVPGLADQDVCCGSDVCHMLRCAPVQAPSTWASSRRGLRPQQGGMDPLGVPGLADWEVCRGCDVCSPAGTIDLDLITTGVKTGGDVCRGCDVWPVQARLTWTSSRRGFRRASARSAPRSRRPCWPWPSRGSRRRAPPCAPSRSAPCPSPAPLSHLPFPPLPSLRSPAPTSLCAWYCAQHLSTVAFAGRPSAQCHLRNLCLG